MSIDEMIAGPELDQAVNVAVGTQTEPIDFVRYDMSESDCNAYYSCHYAPSSDLNHAFVQAERVQLFRSYCLNQGVHGWDVRVLTDELCPPILVDEAPTACIAICRAILRLAELRNSLPPPSPPNLQP